MPAPHWLRVQLSGPRGVLARPMAHLLNRMNNADYKRALDALDFERGETVLELGFGGGVGVNKLLQGGAKVIASEPSEAMRERGYRRWATELAQERLEIWPHSAEQLPQQNVDRALSMNTVYFWDDIDAGFAKLRSIVQSRLVLGIGSTQHLTKVGFLEHGFRVQETTWYEERLRSAGFATTTVISPVDKDSCSLVIAEVE